MPQSPSTPSVDEPLGQVHKPLRQVVTDAIRSSIIDGTYAPGQRLYEDRLAADLGVSRNPVRESLQALAAEGFIVLQPRRGASVAAIDQTRARELFELRGALEGLVASLAAERRTDDQVAQLLEIADTGAAAAAAGQLARLPELNTAFHDRLATVAGNAMLAASLAQLAGVIRWIYAERLEERVGDSWSEHRAIADAIAAGDAASARARAEAHVAAARAAFLGK